MRTRKLVGIIIGLTALLTASMSCTNSSEEIMRFYVGTYATGSEPGIYSCEFDASTQEIKVLSATFQIENPSFQVLSPDGKYLYSVAETADYQETAGGGVYAYKINADYSLTLINSVSSGGAHPCHLSIHPSGKLLFGANYTGGNIFSLRINPDGSLRKDLQSVQHLGSGPASGRQDKAHAHSANIIGDGRYLLACDLGIDKVMGYKVSTGSGQLIPHEEGTSSVSPGSGPRHLAMSIDGRLAFVISELNSTITSCSYDATSGKLDTLSTVSTLPAEFDGESYCADIHVHPEGEFLYASNRGHNSIAVFKIEQDGQLVMVQTHEALGDWPRNFAIDMSGKYLFVANQKSDNLAVLEIDSESGKLTDIGANFEVPQPVCITFRK